MGVLTEFRFSQLAELSAFQPSVHLTKFHVPIDQIIGRVQYF